ncbi:TonB-dependent siderophore receptor [Altericista sp. CCNU0014]|uniref:TonB-dependent siderophore receptor n=1 Tax=Altericista sp. CCNU0014 TaxID=3082949 RepID=UPI00384CAF5B
MKKVQIFGALCITGTVSMLVFGPAQASETPSTQASDLLAQGAESTHPINITGVRLNPTETGVEVILQTAQGETLQPEARTNSNTTFFSEIPNAILSLPDGRGFRAENPVPGIKSVSVTQLEGSIIQIQAVGETTLPIVSVKAEQSPTVADADATEGEEEVIVTGDRTPSYRVPNSSTATGTDTPILETPFSVQVVPKEVIRDQQATRIEEVLSNVSSVNTLGTDGGRDANFNIRGFGSRFGSRAPLLRDGFRQYDQFQGIPEIGNLEQIEVLKGPSSILYGQIEPGGIINLVPKKPLSEPFYEIELQAGNRDFVRPRIDLSGPLTSDGDLLYRLSALYKHEDNFRGFDNATDRIAIAPSVTWKISDRTKAEFSLEYIYNRGPADFGLTAFGNGVAPVPRDRVINNPDDTITTNFLSLGYNFEHQFNDRWKIRNGFRYLFYDYNYSVVALPFIVEDANVTRFYADQENKSNSYSLYTNAVGKFETGSVKHTLTVGVDLNRTDGSSITLFDANNPSTINIFDPDYNAVPKPPKSTLPLFENTITTSDRLGVYIQDRIKLLDNLTLVAGVRYDTITQKTINTTDTDFVDAGESTQTDSAFTPRIGILYQPIKELSLFANYSQSFNPNTENTTVTGAPLPPERGQGFDLGVKAELFDRKLLATLTYFNITKNNVGVVDPNFPLFSTTIGQEQSQGIELDVAGEILPGWKVIGSYAYTDAKVSKDTNLDNIGNRFVGVPLHSASLWTTYEIQKGPLKGLGFGAGLKYVGDRAGDVENTYTVGDYLIGNAAIFYNRDRYRFALNFKNISNAYYIESSTGNEGGIEPGAPFTVIGSFSVKF